MLNRHAIAASVVLVSGSQVIAGNCDWEPLGTGVAPAAYACAALANGDAVYGGSMTLAGSLVVEHIAIWNGTDWESAGSGVNGFVRAILAEPDGGFIAGGQFTEAGGNVAGLIARWDGAQWTGLGQGLRFGSCRALLRTSDGDLIAGGSFSQADNQPAWGIARWDGFAWTKFGNNTTGGGFSGIFNPKGNSPTMIVDLEEMPNGDIIACGDFTRADGVPMGGIARWDGTQWLPLGSGLSGPARALTLLPSGELMVAGLFGQAGGVSCNGLAVWDGSGWSAVGGGLNGVNASSPFALITTAQGKVVMSGAFDMVDSVQVNNIAMYDPMTGQWSALGSGMLASIQTSVFDVSADAAGTIFAGGQFASAAGNANARNASFFDCNTCPGDIANGDRTVNVDDLNAVLSVFGMNVGIGDARDLANHDGVVDVDDLNIILAQFGATCM
ncbi:MAG: hypothetical protein H6812_04840 [Phycisphaeraceae bacterium]|nr:hypothetical protein [Phycisphaerales bacterium]MCA9305710.1 hypothetical protein [Phycisphaerales bacterium]MCB9842566.1 hypothetical protein [Phycisphaeraceae bacterium]